MELRNNRTGTTLRSDDGLLSPRAGLVYKPIDNVSLYASYSMAYQPRAGEQLASLSASNASLEPETFRNREVGDTQTLADSSVMDLIQSGMKGGSDDD